MPDYDKAVQNAVQQQEEGSGKTVNNIPQEATVASLLHLPAHQCVSSPDSPLVPGGIGRCAAGSGTRGPGWAERRTYPAAHQTPAQSRAASSPSAILPGASKRCPP